MSNYQARLRDRLREYKRQHFPGSADGVWHDRGQIKSYAHILPNEHHEANILPAIRDRFWNWFGHVQPAIKLHRDFGHLSSSQAMCFNLFFPFVNEDSGRVDTRLLKALGLPADRQYTGHFEKILDTDENTRFDLYLESRDQKIFFEVGLSESEFGSCENDEQHCQKLEQHYRPYLTNQVDSRWLERDTFFQHYQILRRLSYLGRHPDSGLVFIFPKANESLAESDEAIKKMVSKSLAPRVAILYLEYLVARILTLTEEDAPLHEHFLQFKEKYVVPKEA